MAVSDCPTTAADVLMSTTEVTDGLTSSTSDGGITVTLSCSTGYRLVGNSQLTCFNGEWSSTPPTCVPDFTDDTTVNTLLPGNQAGDHTLYAGLTWNQVVLVVSCCVSFLAALCIFTAIFGLVICCQRRRRINRQLEAAAIKLPLGTGDLSSSSGETTAGRSLPVPLYDNQSFAYDVEFDGGGGSSIRPVTSDNSSTPLETSPPVAPASAATSTNLPPVVWSSDKMQWHDSFDYSRVRIPRPKILVSDGDDKTSRPIVYC